MSPCQTMFFPKFPRTVLCVILPTAIALVSGCSSYTTLQGAKVLAPGQFELSGGSALPLGANGPGLIPEVAVRAGVIPRVDLGAKFIPSSFALPHDDLNPDIYMVDGKVELIKEPVTVSADLAWSYESWAAGPFKGSGATWYPMIICGQESWYVGLKALYSTYDTKVTDEDDFLDGSKFHSSGWETINFVVGARIGNKLKFVPEINFVQFIGSNVPIIMPAFALQYDIK